MALRFDGRGVALVGAGKGRPKNSGNPAEIGFRIRRLRLTRGITPAEFARRTGARPSTIQNYESGNRAPDQRMLMAMAQELGVSALELRVGSVTDTQVQETPIPEPRKLGNVETNLLNQREGLARWWTSRRAILLSAGWKYDELGDVERMLENHTVAFVAACGGKAFEVSDETIEAIWESQLVLLIRCRALIRPVEASNH